MWAEKQTDMRIQSSVLRFRIYLKTEYNTQHLRH